MSSYNNDILKEYRGDTIDFELKFPYNITGHTFTVGFKVSLDDQNSKLKLQVTSDSGDHPDDDPINGVKYIRIPSNLTRKLTPNVYYYGIQKLIEPDIVKTIIVGKIEILPDVNQN